MFRHQRFLVQVLRNLKRGSGLCEADRLVLSGSEQTCDLEDVFNLTSIHVHTCKLGELAFVDCMLLVVGAKEVLPDRFA